MASNRKKRICALLKGIETGDASSVMVVNQSKYIQHNPQTQEGGEGLAALFKRLSKSNPQVNIIRVFEDGDYVFAHTEYDFDSSNIGFEVFRFEGDQTVEHWDNIQRRQDSTASGHTMVNGPTEVRYLDKTEENRDIVNSFINEVLISDKFDSLERYIDKKCYTEHSPHYTDDLSLFLTALSRGVLKYKINHRLLAEGDFVLSASEGLVNDVHTAFYDLYRVESGKIVEHWDTNEEIPSRDVWKNNNGKF